MLAANKLTLSLSLYPLNSVSSFTNKHGSVKKRKKKKKLMLPLRLRMEGRSSNALYAVKFNRMQLDFYFVNIFKV